MANVRAGNTWYVDATGDLESTTTSVRVVAILVSPSTSGAGNPNIILKDRSPENAIKLNLDCPNNETIQFDFKDYPVEFYGGIKVSTLSGCVATIILA